MIKKMFLGKLNKGQFAIKWVVSSVAYLILIVPIVGVLSQSYLSLSTLLFWILTISALIYRESLYVRRLRDLNRNVWIAAIGLLPFIEIILFVALYFDLNKFILSIIILITIFFASLPIIFFLKIRKDDNIDNHSLRLNKCYLLAKDGIYYYELSEFNIYKKLDAEPGQFVTLDKELCYGKDDNNVYFRDKVLEGEDPDTFVIPEEKY